MELVIKNFPKRIAQGQTVSLVNSTIYLKKNKHQPWVILTTLIPKPHRHHKKRKLWINTSYENKWNYNQAEYTPALRFRIPVVLNKRINQYNTLQYDEIKKSYGHLNQWRKPFDKIHHLFMIKTFRNLGIQGNFPKEKKQFMKNPQST